MLKKIKVYGTLRRFLGQAEFEVDLNTPREAVSFLKCNFDGVEEHIARQHYTIQCGSKVITKDLLNMSTQEDIRIIPIVHGNFFPILLGAGALFAKSALATAFTSTVIGGLISSALTSIGTSLILSGVSSLLSPQQNNLSASGLSSQDPAALGANYSFTGLTNISNAGVPVNLVYGEIMVGSIVVSNGVDTVQVTGTP